MTQMRAPQTGDSFGSNATGNSYAAAGLEVRDVANTDVPEALSRGWSYSGEPGQITSVSASGNSGVDVIETCNASGGAITRTLPQAAVAQFALFKKTDASANAVNVAPNGTDNIDGANSAKTLTAQNQSLRLYSDGVSNWYVF